MSTQWSTSALRRLGRQVFHEAGLLQLFLQHCIEYNSILERTRAIELHSHTLESDVPPLPAAAAAATDTPTGLIGWEGAAVACTVTVTRCNTPHETTASLRVPNPVWPEH